MLVGSYEWLRIAFPVAHAVGAFLVAYVARIDGRFPMPLNLRLLFGLMTGLLTGMIAFFSIAVLEPVRLAEFHANLVVHLSMALYFAGGVFAFLAGHQLASRRRLRRVVHPIRRAYHWSYPLAAGSTIGAAVLGALQYAR